MGFGLLGGLGFILLLLIAVPIIIWVSNGASRNGGVQSPPAQNNAANYNNAINILNERLARGEISEEEYARKKSEILK